MASVTQGWDLVAAITQSTLNGLLSDAYPTITVNNSVDGMGFDGTIGTPTVNLNPSNTVGTNSLAQLTFPIAGTITVEGNANSLASGATITFTANLTYLTVEGTDSNNQLALTIDWTSDLVVYDVTLTGLSQSLDDILGGLILGFLQTEASSTNSYPLGTINVASLPVGLQPTGTADFAIQTNASDPDRNTLAMLMLTNSGTAPSSFDFGTAAPLLVSGQEAALYISDRVMMETLVGPPLAAQLGVTLTSSDDGEGDYTLSFNGSVDLPNPPAKIHQVTLTSVSASVNSNQVAISYSANAYPSFNVDKGYWVEITGELLLEPVLHTSSTGQTIVFTVDSPKPSGKIHAKPAVWVVLIAAIIATFGSVSVFIAGIVVAVLSILLTYLTFPINSVSGMGADVQSGIQQINWPAQKSFPLTQIMLPSDFVLLGAPATAQSGALDVPQAKRIA